MGQRRLSICLVDPFFRNERAISRSERTLATSERARFRSERAPLSLKGLTQVVRAL